MTDNLNKEKRNAQYSLDYERREFLKIGLKITGVMAGGSILSLISNINKAYSLDIFRDKYPYKPHYAMVLRQDRCIDCKKCMVACVATNNVPDYGWRTIIFKRKIPASIDQKSEFIPILCNQCNNPPCVRTCPTRATYKDKTNGIVMMNNKKCIGCKSCMMACPYNARYYNEAKKAIDKCDFCLESRLAKGWKIVACSEACPADVRVFGDLSDPASRVFKLVHQLQKPVWVLREEVGAKPNVFYMKG
jgi:tetrathionate reductase subunit B